MSDEIRNEHSGTVTARYEDPGAPTREQMIRVQAASIAAHRLGPMRQGDGLTAKMATEFLIQAARQIADWIDTGGTA